MATSTLLIPPPQVVWAWLSYFYRVTGEWLMPPGDSQEAGCGTQTLGSPGSETLVAISGKARPFDNNPCSASATLTQNHAAEEIPTTIGWNTPPISYQVPFPNLIAYSPVEDDYSASPGVNTPLPLKKRSKARQSTGFDYVHSAYFKEAERLVQTAGSSTYTIKPELLFGAKLLLAIILAWCHFPLFNGMSGRSGQWMTLAFDQIAREGISRAASLRPLIRELQNARLIAPGLLATEAISREEFEKLRYDFNRVEVELGVDARRFWPLRGIQEKNNIYKLLVKPDPTLPEFNPFSFTPATQDKKVPGKDVAGGLSLSQKEKDCTGKDVILPHSGLEATSKVGYESERASLVPLRSFQVISQPSNFKKEVEVEEVEEKDNFQPEFEKPLSTDLNFILQPGQESGDDDSKIKYGPSKKTTNETHLDRIIAGMRPSQRENYDYLREKACFSDNNGLIFEMPQSQITLDKRGAARLAVLEGCNLEKLKQHHAQVREKWLAGECYNPLGLFYSSVLWDKDLRSRGDPVISFTGMVNRKAAYEVEGEDRPSVIASTTNSSVDESPEGKVDSNGEYNTSSVTSRVTGGNSSQPSSRGYELPAAVERRGVMAENAQTGKRSSNFQTGQRYYSGRPGSGYSRWTEGKTGRPGNPDCTNYDEW